MTPRRSDSVPKNKTRLPQDALKLITDTLKENFSEYLADKPLAAEGYLYLEEILLRVGFKEKGAIRQFNFECSLDFNSENKTEAMELLYVAVDAIQSMVHDYIEADGDIEFPQNWTSFEFEGKTLWLKTSTVNTDLEAQADALLGEEFLENQEKIDEEFVDELFAALRVAKNTQH